MATLVLGLTGAWLRGPVVLVMLVVAACARQAPESHAESAPPTVFTDTALFRRFCAEADSGILITARRCTPRDQGRRIP